MGSARGVVGGVQGTSRLFSGVLGLYVALRCGFGTQHVTYDASKPVWGPILINFDALEYLKTEHFHRDGRQF